MATLVTNGRNGVRTSNYELRKTEPKAAPKPSAKNTTKVTEAPDYAPKGKK